MTTELRMASTELNSRGTLYKPPQPSTRNLGSAIFLAAIEDYRSMCDELHESAETVSVSANTCVAGAIRLGSGTRRRTGPGMAAGCARSIARPVGWTAVCPHML